MRSQTHITETITAHSSGHPVAFLVEPVAQWIEPSAQSIGCGFVSCRATYFAISP